ncbi:hypothetical protein BDD12DRAFT_747152 [Trichophaea hybrida]|nr:hypothetical protein BDD12DRAFT_747152 [Trichophaea hybrida]
MPSPPGSAPSNESALIPPNPTPTTHSRRGSIPKSIPAWSSGDGSYEDTLRKDMSLVAEAAKRASVQIVVRDLKDCRV